MTAREESCCFGPYIQIMMVSLSLPRFDNEISVDPVVSFNIFSRFIVFSFFVYVRYSNNVFHMHSSWILRRVRLGQVFSGVQL